LIKDQVCLPPVSGVNSSARRQERILSLGFGSPVEPDVASGFDRDVGKVTTAGERTFPHQFIVHPNGIESVERTVGDQGRKAREVIAYRVNE
jgi:hypothetical protein